jgi:hypothetical protein
MIRNLREYIPKATGNFFIKSLKTNMNFYLLQYISKNPEMCDDLEEDQDVAQKRAYYIDAQKKFKKINKAIGVDEQLSKYFKEDNTKIIENILQNQGINSQNAQEISEKEKEKKPAKPSISINDIGVPPKKETNNISQATKNNLFGNTSTKANNLFGNPPAQNKPEGTPSQKKAQNTNLFGPKTGTNNANDKKTTNNQTPKNNNLFGNLGSSISKGANNLFGNIINSNSNNANKNTPKVNQPNQKQNKDLNVSLKVDPKEGNITGINVKGNIEPKDAMNFYNKNKQNLPTGQQMMNAAQKVTNQGNNNNNTGKKVNALANLFGAKK